MFASKLGQLHRIRLQAIICIAWCSYSANRGEKLKHAESIAQAKLDCWARVCLCIAFADWCRRVQILRLHKRHQEFEANSVKERAVMQGQLDVALQFLGAPKLQRCKVGEWIGRAERKAGIAGVLAWWRTNAAKRRASREGAELAAMAAAEESRWQMAVMREKWVDWNGRLSCLKDVAFVCTAWRERVSTKREVRSALLCKLQAVVFFYDNWWLRRSWTRWTAAARNLRSCRQVSARSRSLVMATVDWLCLASSYQAWHSFAAKSANAMRKEKQHRRALFGSLLHFCGIVDAHSQDRLLIVFMLWRLSLALEANLRSNAHALAELDREANPMTLPGIQASCSAARAMLVASRTAIESRYIKALVLHALQRLASRSRGCKHCRNESRLLLPVGEACNGHDSPWPASIGLDFSCRDESSDLANGSFIGHGDAVPSPPRPPSFASEAFSTTEEVDKGFALDKLRSGRAETVCVMTPLSYWRQQHTVNSSSPPRTITPLSQWRQTHLMAAVSQTPTWAHADSIEETCEDLRPQAPEALSTTAHSDDSSRSLLRRTCDVQCRRLSGRKADVSPAPAATEAPDVPDAMQQPKTRAGTICEVSLMSPPGKYDVPTQPLLNDVAATTTFSPDSQEHMRRSWCWPGETQVDIEVISTATSPPDSDLTSASRVQRLPPALASLASSRSGSTSSSPGIRTPSSFVSPKIGLAESLDTDVEQFDTCPRNLLPPPRQTKEVARDASGPSRFRGRSAVTSPEIAATAQASLRVPALSRSPQRTSPPAMTSKAVYRDVSGPSFGRC